ncbi:hypothetical protein N9948_00815 [bacterium]|nr:hypothetical protein [bacterium]
MTKKIARKKKAKKKMTRKKSIFSSEFNGTTFDEQVAVLLKKRNVWRKNSEGGYSADAEEHRECLLEESKRILGLPVKERTKKDINSLRDIIYNWNEVSLKNKNNKKIKKFSRRSKYTTIKRGEC